VDFKVLTRLAKTLFQTYTPPFISDNRHLLLSRKRDILTDRGKFVLINVLSSTQSSMADEKCVGAWEYFIDQPMDIHFAHFENCLICSGEHLW
jgi:hypothetical protein